MLTFGFYFGNQANWRSFTKGVRHFKRVLDSFSCIGLIDSLKGNACLRPVYRTRAIRRLLYTYTRILCVSLSATPPCVLQLPSATTQILQKKDDEQNTNIFGNIVCVTIFSCNDTHIAKIVKKKKICNITYVSEKNCK